VSTFTIAKDALAKNPGTLFWAPPATSLPDYTVAASVFSVNAWTGWFQLGITKEGHVFNVDVKNEPIQAAEYLDDIDQVDTGRVVTLKFELMRITATNLVRALNRPTAATTGSGTTLRTTVKMPALGAGLYCMIGWQSQDDTERVVCESAYQIGSVSVARKKGADVATLALEYKCFPNASGDPFTYDSAGTLRG
jgi:hypothetical protein